MLFPTCIWRTSACIQPCREAGLLQALEFQSYQCFINMKLPSETADKVLPMSMLISRLLFLFSVYKINQFKTLKTPFLSHPPDEIVETSHNFCVILSPFYCRN